jgi:hypothetical protein
VRITGNLLLVRAIGILVRQLNLSLAKISAVGVHLQASDRYVIRVALVWPVLYFAFAFVAYAPAHFSEWWGGYTSGCRRYQQGKNVERFRSQTELDFQHWPLIRARRSKTGPSTTAISISCSTRIC